MTCFTSLVSSLFDDTVSSTLVIQHEVVEHDGREERGRKLQSHILRSRYR
jgi:hypothetical protein